MIEPKNGKRAEKKQPPCPPLVYSNESVKKSETWQRIDSDKRGGEKKFNFTNGKIFYFQAPLYCIRVGPCLGYTSSLSCANCGKTMF